MARIGHPSGRDGTAGSWPGSTPVTSAEFAYFDQGVYKAISETGGTYALDSALIIGGAAVTFSGYTTTFYGITCTGVLSAQSTANLTGGGQLGTSSSNVWFFAGTTNITGPVAFNGGTSGTHQTVAFGSYCDITVSANSTFTASGNVTFHGQTSIIGAVTQIGASGTDTLDVYATPLFHNGVTFNATVNYAGQLVIQNTGQFSCAAPAFFTGPVAAGIQNITASGTAISVNVAGVILRIVGGGVAALPTSGMLTGQIIEIVNKQTSTNVNLQASGGTVFNLHNTGTNTPWVRLIYNVSVWEALSFGDYAA